jgi:hypothetical protein
MAGGFLSKKESPPYPQRNQVPKTVVFGGEKKIPSCKDVKIVVQ